MKTPLFSLTVLLPLAAWCAPAAAAPPTTMTYEVNSAAGSHLDVGSLPWAVFQANYTGADINYINFNIPGGGTGEIVINLAETLFIARPMIIDASTEPGYSGQPRIRINCGGDLDSGFNIVKVTDGSIPPLSDGSAASGAGSTIQGFRITNYRSNGITLSHDAGGCLVEDNQIGFIPLSGGAFAKNTTDHPMGRGIGIASNSNTIRGNTISGVDNGITLGPDTTETNGFICKNNSFEDNRIGTDSTGTIKIGNTSDGIFLGLGAQGNLIGPGNVLSGMDSSGVELLDPTATGNTIFGNMIGLNAAGTAAIGNGELGVLIANGANNNSVGGPYGGIYPGNVISGNTKGGVAIGTNEFPGANGSNNNHVEGNLIGTDAAETKALGTQGQGITVQNGAKGNTLRKNVIVNETTNGVVLSDADGNFLYGNWIGVTSKGKAIANVGYGVFLTDSSNNIIQLSAQNAKTGMERNIFGTNTLGPVGVFGASTNNTIDLGPDTNSASQLENLSARKQVGVGENVLIGGFIVSGTQDKKILLRGLGPTLPVPGPLANPTLELHDADGNVLASNNDWQDDPAQAAEILATGIPPDNALESAIVASLPAKPLAQGGAGYTAILAGRNGGKGIGLLEMYDLDIPADSKLANISTRGFVGAEPDVLIGGFIPGPPDRESVMVLVRGLGPSLVEQNVSGVLGDPLLEIHDSNGSIVAENDNWQDAPNKADIEATGIPPTNDLEAAILISLPPTDLGYTAVVRGANGTTGIGLVEIYDLD